MVRLVNNPILRVVSPLNKRVRLRNLLDKHFTAFASNTIFCTWSRSNLTRTTIFPNNHFKNICRTCSYTLCTSNASIVNFTVWLINLNFLKIYFINLYYNLVENYKVENRLFNSRFLLLFKNKCNRLKNP
jgi:hypothetical protein